MCRVDRMRNGPTGTGRGNWKEISYCGFVRWQDALGNMTYGPHVFCPATSITLHVFNIVLSRGDRNPDVQVSADVDPSLRPASQSRSCSRIPP